jgi:hypothetical protein
MEAVEAPVTKSKELGRQRLAAAIETGKHKKTLFES